MSADILAATLNTSLGPELNALAEEHLKHDLQQSDRDALQKAAGTLSTHLRVGAIVGMALGIVLAYRLRANRTAMFNAFKTREKPTAIKFADGREELLPDMTNLMKPSVFGDVATYTFLGAGGLFMGGQTGVLTGFSRAGQHISADRESRERIETAFRRFKADALRKQASELDDRKIPALGI